MKRVSVLAPVCMAAILVATSVAASPALIIGIAAVATAVAVSASQQPHEAWAYTDKYGWVGGADADVSGVDVPLQSKSGISRRLIEACREALISTGKRYDLAELEVGGAGRQIRANGRLDCTARRSRHLSRQWGSRSKAEQNTVRAGSSGAGCFDLVTHI